MSLGRTSTFLDIYFERDIAAGLMTESEAQEIMDDFVLHLRMARHLRTPEYNELFGGDPMWITEAVGGIGEDGRHMVTKNSYRMLNTLYNLNAAAEPNLTVLWAKICRRTGRSSSQRYLSTRMPCSTRTMTLCARTTAMITQSRVLRIRDARR